MRSVREAFAVGETKGDIGVEVEIEGSDLPGSTPMWKKEHDGSLRGEENGEWVLRRPVSIENLSGAFQELSKAFENSEIEDTYRAGVHVHINVQDLSTVQLINFVCVFLILEELFVDFCAPSRRGNHFCLRTKDAEYMKQLLWRACEENNLKLLYTDDIRYGAMNLKSLFQYGSVEFRSLESTKDFSKIETWCRMLYKIREAALKYKDPREIMYSVSLEGYGVFVESLMGEWATTLLKTDSWQKKVRHGILNAQDIAFSRKWDEVNLNIFSKNNVFGG
jgi:hypothetical protein